jgi:hypothetical protein
MFELRVHISATARSEYQLGIITGGWIGGRDICGHRVPIKDHEEWVDQRKTSVDTVSIKAHDGWVDRWKRHLWTQSVSQRSLCVGGSAEEPSVDTECQSKIMMGGWISGRDICGHSINQSSWWVGGSEEETSVDTECAAEIMMGGWMSGRHLWTQRQSKLMMGGWIGGRDICGHCSYRLNLSKFASDFQHVYRYY